MASRKLEVPKMNATAKKNTGLLLRPVSRESSACGGDAVGKSGFAVGPAHCIPCGRYAGPGPAGTVDRLHP